MIRKIFDRLFVVGFYQTYAGLFLFGGLLMIGVFPPGQIISINITIAQALSSNAWAGAGACAVWAVYLGIVAAFIQKKIKEVPFRFLQYSATAIPLMQQRKIWLRVLLAMGLPVYGYGLGCVLLGFRAGHLVIATCMSAFLLAATSLLLRLANRGLAPAKQSSAQRRWKVLQTGGNNYTLLGLRHLLTGQKTDMAVSKVLSYLLITGMFFVFSDLHDHPDVAALIVVAVVLAHSSLLRGQFQFEQGSLAFMRNLPFRARRRWLVVMGRIALILLPEMVWILGRYGPLNALHLLFFMLGFASLIYHLSFMLGNNDDLFVKVLFFLFFAMVILVPFGIATYLGVVCFVGSRLLYRFP